MLTVTTRSGRPTRPTEKMMQFFNERQTKKLCPEITKLQLENEILKTQLEISQAEASIKELSIKVGKDIDNA